MSLEENWDIPIFIRTPLLRNPFSHNLPWNFRLSVVPPEISRYHLPYLFEFTIVVCPPSPGISSISNAPLPWKFQVSSTGGMRMKIGIVHF